MIKISPSILAADVLHMGQEVKEMLDLGVDMLHLDIMDGHFVPNISYGPDLVKSLHKAFPNAVNDVHLMLSEPEKYIDVFCDAGANIITVHQEVGHEKQLIDQIKAHQNVGAGLSVKPNTPVETLFPYLDVLDMVLIMTVEPGFGGQKLIQSATEKINVLRQKGYQGMISVDGGVTLQNADDLVQLGADVLVLGTALFKAENRQNAISFLHGLEKK